MKKLTTSFLILLIVSYSAFAQNKAERTIDSLIIAISHTPFCSYTECTTLQAVIVSGNPPFTYSWSTSETMSEIKVCPHADSVVKVRVVDREGLQKEAVVTLKASPRPDVTLTATDTIGCPVFCTRLTAGGAENYNWFYNGQTVSGSPITACLDTTTTIRLIGNAKGCADTVFYKINVLPKVRVKISGKLIIGPAEVTTLTAVISSPVKIMKYVWQPVDSMSQSITVRPTQTTTYTVIAVDANGCVSLDTATVKVIPNPGVIENPGDAASFEIYPHPVTDVATISFQREQKNARLRILDMLGKEVRNIPFSGKEVRLEKGNLKSGIYFIQVTSNNKIVQSKKLIIR